MIYLKNIANELTNNKDIINTVKSFNNDEEIYYYLLENNINRKNIIEVLENYYAINHILTSNENLEGFNKKIFTDKNINAFLAENNILVLEKEDKIYVILDDILNGELIEFITDLLSDYNNIVFKFAFNFEIKEFLQNFNDNNEPLSIYTEESIRINPFGFNVVDWVNLIIKSGIDLRASDIHLEPYEKGLQIRYRIDGDLQKKTLYEMTDDIKSKILSRIKVISGMDLSESRKPQDGKIADFNHNDILYEIRVSTILLILGEKIVLRIARRDTEYVNFKELGFDEETIKETKSYLQKQNGIIFVGGATGSGKTTTLYTMIEYLNNDSKNIYTIENPVEKRVDNINQIEIHEKAGVTYVNTLKALLRQDPDIIVVGEIRDLETAELAANGSLTGHLMLSTVHANNAVSSITRLLDMGIEPFLLGSTAIAFYSQRLVKKLCPHCKQKKTTINKEETVWLKMVEEKYGICYNLEEIIKNNDLYEEVGCSNCLGGTKGRIVLVENLKVTDNIKHDILEKKNEKEILTTALNEGYRPFVVDGMNKVINGEISLKTLIQAEIL